MIAIGASERDRGLRIADARLVYKAVGRQICIPFSEGAQDTDLLRRLSMAYEMAAIEGLKDFLNPAGNIELREQCVAGAWRAFEIARLASFPCSGNSDYCIGYLNAGFVCSERSRGMT